ncbi:MAG: macrocin O-methyltransferase, partial [Spirochaetales bacterium]|nr:macrocin O-methyltransferase [Spirochaetales bacterium]
KPDKISLLRLDTDWYASTVEELETLYPLLVEKGVLIIDDYGHFDGARKAVDEYFITRSILLNRIDYTGRIGVKIS